MTAVTEAEGLVLVDPAQTYLREATAKVLDDGIDVETGVIECRIVPYEHEANLGSGLHEIFSAAAFASACGNPSRVKCSDQQHNRAVNIGRALELRDESDALYGKVKIADTSAGRDVLTLLREKVLEELSIEFRPMKGKHEILRRGPGDILIRHHKAELVGLSPVGAGAYGNEARVLMVRQAEMDRAREAELAYLDSLTAGRARR